MKIWEEFLKLDGWHSSYTSVDKFLRHYARKTKSEKTRENVCGALMLFCRYCSIDPDSLVAASPEEASRLCQAFTDSLHEKDFSIRYANVSQAYLSTFFKENDFTGNRALTLEHYYQPARYRKRAEYVPTSEEVYKMGYAAGSAKNRAMLFALYTSGLRNSTLRGIRIKDVKEELDAGKNCVKISVYPEMKQVDSGACKGNIPYFTFIGSEATQAIRDYLKDRKQKQGNMSDEEPLFCSDSNQISHEKQSKVPVSKKGLEDMVTRAARHAGIDKWSEVTPKCLRKAFESVLRNNGLDPKDQEFLVGHILPGVQDPYYDSTKVEELRTKYAKLVFFRTAQVNKLDMIKSFAQTLGVDRIEVKIQKLREQHSELDESEALGRIVRQELGINPLAMKTVKYHKNNEKNDCNDGNCIRYETKIVTENKLLHYLDEGWKLVKELRSGKIVISHELSAPEN